MSSMHWTRRKQTLCDHWLAMLWKEEWEYCSDQGNMKEADEGLLYSTNKAGRSESLSYSPLFYSILRVILRSLPRSDHHNRLSRMNVVDSLRIAVWNYVPESVPGKARSRKNSKLPYTCHCSWASAFPLPWWSHWEPCDRTRWTTIHCTETFHSEEVPTKKIAASFTTDPFMDSWAQFLENLSWSLSKVEKAIPPFSWLQTNTFSDDDYTILFTSKLCWWSSEKTNKK